MIIVDTIAFRAAAEAIANLRPCLMEGRVTADQVKVALAERLNLWPASIYADLSGETRTLTLDAAREVMAAGEPVGGAVVTAG